MSFTSRYQLKELLGQGGYGVVHRAWDEGRGCEVALKLLDGCSGETLRRFKQEFRALAHLSHPNLIGLHELIRDGDRWVLIMELLPDAVPFQTWVHPSGCDPVRLRAALRQLADGLLTLHANGWVHRDIKPSNVLVTSAGRVVLLDFGLVAEMGSDGMARSLNLVGTMAYASPELATGEGVGTPADWYSVGVILYEALTGQVPISGGWYEVFQKKLEPLPPAVDAALNDSPPDLAELCRDLLRPNPTDRPTGREVIERLGGPVSVADVPRSGLLVGRDAEMTHLRQAFEDSGTHMVTVYIHGLSGMGKSALMTGFTEDLRGTHPQAVVLSGRCYEHEEVPYKAFDAVIDELTRWFCAQEPREVDSVLPPDVMVLTRIFPVLLEVPAIASGRYAEVEEGDPASLRRRASRALRELLSTLARRHRLVVDIDDLQWTDEESTHLLQEVMAPPKAPPLLLVVACRRGELQAERLPGEDVREVPLEELPPQAGRELATRLLREEHPDLDGLVRDAGGSPYLLSELIMALHAGLTATLTLDEALARRMGSLPEPARQILEVLSLVGRPLPLAVVQRVAGLEDAEGPLRYLRTQHLVRSVDKRLSTYHDRIRETIERNLDPERRRALHKILAQQPELDAEAVIHHHLEAGDADLAARLIPAAAGSAMEGMAFHRAIRLYRLALRLLGEAAPLSLQVQLAEALVSAGRGREAADCYRDAAARSEGEQAVDLARRAAHEYLCSGHVDEGLAMFARVGITLAPTPQAALLGLLGRRALLSLRGTGFRERAEADVPSAELQRVDACWSAVVGLSMVDTVQAAEMQTRHAGLALQCGEPMRVARALAWEVAFCSGFKGSDGLVESRRQACQSLLDRLHNPELSARCAHTLGLGIFLVGKFAPARVQFEAAIRGLANLPGSSWSLNNSHLFRFICAWYLGEPQMIAEGYSEQLAISRDQGDRYAEVNLLTRFGWIVACMADDGTAAREAADHSMALWSNRGYHLLHWYRWLGQVEASLYQGDAAAAWHEVEAQWPAYQKSALPMLQICNIVALDLRARTALLMSRETKGSAQRDWIRRATADAGRIEREGRGFGNAMAALLRLGLARGREDEMERTSRAETLAQQADMAMHAAAARFRRGQVLGGTEGSRLQEEAAEQLRLQSVTNPVRLLSALTP